MSTFMKTSRMRRSIPAHCLAFLFAIAAVPAIASANPGELDRGFGEQGRAIGPPETSFVDMASLPDGRLIIATEGRLRAYLPDGRADDGFGEGGAVKPISPEGGEMAIKDIAVDGHGRIVVVGSAPHPVGAPAGTTVIGGGSYATIERYSPNGKLDAGFGNGGLVFTDLGLPPPARPAGIPDYAQISVEVAVEAVGVAVDSRERIVLTGTRAATYTAIKLGSFNRVPEAFVAQLTADGSPDPTFNTTGTTPLGGLGSIGRPVVDSQGGIYFVASRQPTSQPSEWPQRKVVGHLNSDGRVDPAFAKGGWRALPYDTSASNTALTLDRRGRLLLGQGGDSDIERLEPNGSVDRSFGHDGVAAIVRRKGEVAVNGLAVTDSGRILAVGRFVRQSRSVQSGPSWSLLLARLTPSGRIDRRFGTTGTVVTRFGAKSTSEGLAVLADANGGAVVGGTTYGPSLPLHSVLARYLLGS